MNVKINYQYQAVIRAWLAADPLTPIFKVEALNREHPRTFASTLSWGGFSIPDRKRLRAALAQFRVAHPLPTKVEKAAAAPRLYNEQVKAAVTEIAQGFKKSVKAQYAAMYRNAITIYEEKCKENPGKTAPDTFWPYSSNVGRLTYFGNQRMRQLVGLFLNSESRSYLEWSQDTKPQEQHRYSLKTMGEVDAIIERRSEKEAEEAIQGFIHKMTGKLCGILDQKTDFNFCQVQGSLGQNSLVFVFNDKSTFTVVNDIIVNTSVLGTPFNQYPTRFTNVRIHEHGTKYAMKGISEAWMKKNFRDK